MICTEAPFLARLLSRADLTAAQIDPLGSLPIDRISLTPERQLVAEGDRPRHLHVLEQGWAAKVKMLPDGRRHFATLLLPGDICDLDGLHLRTYDYGVVALTRCSVSRLDRNAVLALCDENRMVAQLLTWLAFVENALLNQATLSLARRSARDRLAHLLCELMLRLAQIGFARADGYDLPLSQEKIADALGLTPVHINRTFKQLRTERLASLSRQRVSLLDWDGLRHSAGFTPDYLHLDGMRAA